MTIRDQPRDVAGALLSKAPQATLMFWLVKICATTVGETGGDALSMTLKLGYAVATLIFLGFFVVTLAAQIKARRYHALTYWLVVVATTTVGTTHLGLHRPDPSPRLRRPRPPVF